MSPEAERLLADAERVEAACDLEIGLPDSGARLQTVVSELLAEGELGGASPRAIWRLLWVAADLTSHVDVYRAESLLGAVERLFERHFSRALTDEGELADIAEMAFDLFFNRADQPLALHRFEPSLAALARVLELDNRFCQRAALHGLSHLRQHTHTDGQRARLDGVLDAFLLRNADPTMAVYAARSRAGELL
jgi:hypothetical protein